MKARPSDDAAETHAKNRIGDITGFRPPAAGPAHASRPPTPSARRSSSVYRCTVSASPRPGAVRGCQCLGKQAFALGPAPMCRPNRR